MKLTKTTTIIILIILLAIAGAYILFNKYQDMKQTTFIQGYNQGQLDLTIKINQNKQIPVITQEGNQTKINWVSLQDGR